MTLSYQPKSAVSPAEIARYLDVAVDASSLAGLAILPHFRVGLEAENKAGQGGYDPVTAADRLAETIIRERIRSECPGHGLFGEEHGHEPGNGLTWVIDPIDGTRGFMTGMLHWGTLIALFDGEEPVLGVVHQPFTGEFFIGTNDRAEYRRAGLARPLVVRACATLDEAVLAATGPQYFADGPERCAFDALAATVRLTRFGGDCYHYCMLAMGQLDLAVEAGLKPYDIQALMPIVRGAGGVVSTWSGEDASLGGRIVAAGDSRVHRAAMRLLEDALSR
jgi:myo-inositol-1(or 4)-monophosphatase